MSGQRLPRLARRGECEPRVQQQVQTEITMRFSFLQTDRKVDGSKRFALKKVVGSWSSLATEFYFSKINENAFDVQASTCSIISFRS